MGKKTRYLVCVSEKEHSKTALFYACTKAKLSNSEVDMLYVIDPVDYNTMFSVADKIKEERRNDVLKLFTELQEKASKWYGMKPNGIIREGLIAEEVTSQINENNNVAMLMVGVAEDGSSNSQFITNLFQSLGKHLFVPILLVPGNLTKEQIIELNNNQPENKTCYNI